MTATGTYRFQILEVPSPQQFAINIGDIVSDGVPSVGAGNIESPGAIDIYTFEADAGQNVFFDEQGSTSVAFLSGWYGASSAILNGAKRM